MGGMMNGMMNGMMPNMGMGMGGMGGMGGVGGVGGVGSMDMGMGFGGGKSAATQAMISTHSQYLFICRGRISKSAIIREPLTTAAIEPTRSQETSARVKQARSSRAACPSISMHVHLCGNLSLFLFASLPLCLFASLLIPLVV